MRRFLISAFAIAMGVSAFPHFQKNRMIRLICFLISQVRATAFISLIPTTA